jgi:hypothetical protein
LRWIVVAMAVGLLTAIPIYRQVEALTPRARTTETVRLPQASLSIAEGTSDDVLLMDAVSTHLSRTIPAPMEPIMALIRDSDSTTHAGGTQQ